MSSRLEAWTPDSSQCSPVPVSKKKIREAWDDEGEASPMVKKRPAGKEPLKSSQKGRTPKAEITEEEVPLAVPFLVAHCP